MNYKKLEDRYDTIYGLFRKRFPNIEQMRFNYSSSLSNDEKKVLSKIEGLAYISFRYSLMARERIECPETWVPWDVAYDKWTRRGQDFDDCLCKYCNGAEYTRLEGLPPCHICPFAYKGAVRAPQYVLAINALSEHGLLFRPLGEDDPFDVPDIPDIPEVIEDYIPVEEYIPDSVPEADDEIYNKEESIRMCVQKLRDHYNAAGYDASNDNETCPERKVYSGSRDDYCRYLYTARCRLLDYVWQHKGERVGGRTNLAFDICFDAPFTTTDTISDTIGCEMRAKLLELFDKYQANGKFTDAQSNFFRAIEQAGYGYLTNLLGEEDFYESKSGKTPYSDEAMATAYEKWQYEKRKSFGEPVIFHKDRCWFDGALFKEGFRPGPFPGPEFYMRDRHLIYPHELYSWMAKSALGHEKNNLPPVGYLGQAFCALRFSDLLQYYANRWFVFGPETYRLFIQFNSWWINELWEPVY